MIVIVAFVVGFVIGNQLIPWLVFRWRRWRFERASDPRRATPVASLRDMPGVEWGGPRRAASARRRARNRRKRMRRGRRDWRPVARAERMAPDVDPGLL